MLGGVGARSGFVFVEGVWIGSVQGVLLKYRSCLLITMSMSRLHFLYVPSYIGKKLYYHGLRLKGYGLVQRCSNCGPRTTSGPRVLPLWSF